MARDPAPQEKIPGTADGDPGSNDDDARTKEARLVTEEHAREFWETLQKLGRLFH
jgi:hypothetical protein